MVPQSPHPQTSITEILTHISSLSRENSEMMHEIMDRHERMVLAMLDHHSRQLGAAMRVLRSPDQTERPPRGKLPKWMPRWALQSLAQGAGGALAMSALYHGGGDPMRILEVLLKLFS